jgi:hypothetical protein
MLGDHSRALAQGSVTPSERTPVQWFATMMTTVGPRAHRMRPLVWLAVQA